MRIVDGWALCASALEYLPLGRPFGGHRRSMQREGPARRHACTSDIKLYCRLQVGPCGLRRKGRGTLGLPPQGVEKQGYPPDHLVEDGPREPLAPVPGVIRTSHT